jgi:hypothetical protein
MLDIWSIVYMKDDNMHQVKLVKMFENVQDVVIDGFPGQTHVQS